MAVDLLKGLAQQAPDAAERENAANKSVRMALLAKQLGSAKVQTADQGQAAATQSQLQAGQQRVEQLQKQQQVASEVGGLVAQREGLAADVVARQQSMSQDELLANKRAQMAQRLQNETLEDRKRETAADVASAKRVQAIGADYDKNLQFATTKQRNDLARLGNGVKEELLDSRLAFEKDDRGRKFTSSRQLADYAATAAKSDIELQANLQAIEASHENNRILTEGVRDRLAEIQRQGFIQEQGDLDRALKEKLAALQAAAQLAAERAANRKRSSAMQAAAVGQIIGTVAGAAVPGGSAAGAIVGGALGGAAATTYEANKG